MVWHILESSGTLKYEDIGLLATVDENTLKLFCTDSAEVSTDVCTAEFTETQ